MDSNYMIYFLVNNQLKKVQVLYFQVSVDSGPITNFVVLRLVTFREKC